MSLQMNEWTRWHPKGYILNNETIELFNTRLKGATIIRYRLPTGIKEGQIILDGPKRNVKIPKVAFECPECEEEFIDKRNLGIHLKSNMHLWAPKRIGKFLAKYQGEEKHETIPWAEVYYEVIVPREILPIPSSIETSLLERPKKGTKAPTPLEREIHAKAITKWRKEMKAKEGKFKEKIPSLLSNGLYEDRGISLNYWFYRPEIWKAGEWMQISSLDLKDWRKSRHRTLKLLMIVRIDR